MNELIANVHAINDANRYPAFKQNIMGIEKLVLSDRNLPWTEQQQILAVASIARYSTSFWIIRFNTPPANAKDGTMSFFRNLLDAVVCGIVDVTVGVGSASDGDSVQEILQNASDASSLCWDFM